MEENTAAKPAQFDDLSKFIENLKFKKAVVGGVEKESAYQALRTMYSMFIDIYVAEHDAKEQLQKQVNELTQNKPEGENKTDDAAKKALESVSELKAKNEELAEQLKAKNKEKIEWIGKMETLSTEKEKLASELAEKEKELADLNGEAQRLRNEASSATAGFEGERLRLTELADTRAEMVADFEKKMAALCRERDDLKQKLEAANSEMEKNSFMKESLEEVYLDANQRRRDIVAKANQTAQELIDGAQHKAEETDRAAREKISVLYAEIERKGQELEALKGEMENLRQETLRSTEEMKADSLKKTSEECSAMKAQAEEELNQLRAQTQQLCDQQRLQAAQELQKAVSEAQRQSKELLDSAHKKCDDEEKKLSELRNSVSTLRSQTIESLQSNIESLQKFASALSLASETEQE